METAAIVNKSKLYLNINSNKKQKMTDFTKKFVKSMR